MDRARATAMTATTFLLGMALAVGLFAPGCGNGSGTADAQTLPIDFVDMTFAGDLPIVAQVGDALLRGVLDGHVAVDSSTGSMNGQVTCVFDDGLQVLATFRNSEVTLEVPASVVGPATTVLIGNGDSDVVLVNDREQDMRQMARAFVDGMQRDPRPSVQVPEQGAIGLFWLLRLTWAWYLNAWAAQTTPKGRPFSEIGVRFVKRLECACTTALLVESFKKGGCADLEQRCAGRR